jgi:hypothetical protein
MGQIPFNFFRVDGISAKTAPNKVCRYHLFPATLEQVLEFYSLLGADPPTVSASGAEDDVVENGSFFSFIRKTQGVGWAILNAGQATVAILVYLKVRHIFSNVVSPNISFVRL